MKLPSASQAWRDAQNPGAALPVFSVAPAPSALGSLAGSPGRRLGWEEGRALQFPRVSLPPLALAAQL